MPLPPKLKRAINKYSKRDKKLMKKFYPYESAPGDLKLYILAHNGRDRKFTLLGSVDSWTADFDSYRDRTKFSVSTTREDFGDGTETFFEIIRRATHIAKNGELYAIRDGDTVQAFFFDWSYKIYGRLEAQRSFALSDTQPQV